MVTSFRLLIAAHQHIARQNGLLDFPTPQGYPDFPHHTLTARYFDAYVDRFGFRERIEFETEVRNWRQRLSDGLQSDVDSGAIRHYDALCVANGHHWAARWRLVLLASPDASRRAALSHSYIDPIPGRLHRQECGGGRRGNKRRRYRNVGALPAGAAAQCVSIRALRLSFYLRRISAAKLLDADDPHPSEDPTPPTALTWLVSAMALPAQDPALVKAWRYISRAISHGSHHPTISSEDRDPARLRRYHAGQ